MEARRRLSVLCSHLVAVDKELFSGISMSSCAANDGQCMKGSEEKDCVFCKIIRGELPSFKVHEDDVCICILDLNPLSHGHSLLIPKCHFSSLECTPPSVVASMCSKIPFLSSAIMKATNCGIWWEKAYCYNDALLDSFNVVVNNGGAAGQVIFHTHLHIIPRKDHDRLWNSETFSRQPLKLSGETDELAGSIRKQLSMNTSHEDIKG